MAKSIRNLIFDWSGTLYDDFRASYFSTCSIIKRFGGPHLTVADYREQFDLPVWQFYRRHVKNVSIDEIDRDYFDHFGKTAQNGRLCPNVRKLLIQANAEGKRIFIFSTVKQSLLEELVKKNKISQYFSGVFGSIRDKERSLPAFCKKFKLKKSETLFVGDMEHDVCAAKKAGVYSGVFLSGYHSPQRLLNLAPDFVWNDQRGFMKFLHHVSRDHNPPRPPLNLRGGEKRGGREKKPTVTVGALIFNRGEVFLVQTHKWNHIFGIPGGKIKHGETMEAALKREIWEETRLKIQNIEWAMVHNCIHSKEFYRPQQHFVLLNFYATSRSRKFVLNEEAESGFWIDPRRALKLNLNEPTRILLERYLRTEKGTW